MGDGRCELAKKKCVPCQGGVEPLGGEELEKYKGMVGERWEVVEGKKLSGDFKFKNFKAALDFVAKVGAIAEEEGHHPDICFGWGKAHIEIWTHKIGGLHENDFILASKIDEVS